MSEQYDLITYIGRFSGFHVAHEAIVRQALKLAKFVNIVIGSANEPATCKNPFSYAQRKDMILVCFSPEEQARLSFSANEDWLYDENKWNQNVRSQVSACVANHNLDFGKVGLIGYDKDASSYYLKQFPNWDFVKGISLGNISSTTIRNQWYEQGCICVSEFLPPAVGQYLQQHSDQLAPLIGYLSELYKQQQNLDKRWSGSPYPPIFQTVDAYVTRKINDIKHILLVQRRDNNLFALPGGYLDVNETLETGIKRELLEETNLGIGNHKPTYTPHQFDHPRRSQKGRLITTVFPYDLDIIMSNFGEFTIDIKGGDDAKDAIWVPLQDIKRSNMHDDHFQIINLMTEKTNH